MVELIEDSNPLKGLDIRTPEQEADVVVTEVKRELRGLFVKSDELVKRLGNALKKIVKKERDICEEIKIALKEEIAEGIISARTIELQFPPEWKRKTKPTLSKLEDKPRHKVAVMQGGQSITETEKEDGNGLDTSSPARGAVTDINFDTLAPKSDSTTITQLQEETASRPGNGGIGQHQQPVCKHCQAKDAKIMELEEVVAVRTQSSIKSAEELMHRSTDGYQQLEFSVLVEPLRQHIVYPVNKTLPDRVWLNVKFNRKTGEVVDVLIGRRTDTDTADVSRMTP